MATPDISRSLSSEASQVTEEIRKLPPAIGANDVRTRLGTIAAGRMEWRDEDDLGVRRELRHIANQLDRMRALKSVAAFWGFKIL